MSKSKLSMGTGLLAVVVLLAGVTAASADIEYFENAPVGDPGRYVWPATTDDHYLNVTLPFDEQVDIVAPSAFCHLCADTLSMVAGGSTGEVQRGGLHSALLFAFDYGEEVSAEVSDPNNGSWGNGGYAVHPSIGSNFQEGAEKYVGVQFPDTDGIHYGWIGVTRTGVELDAFAWGYETEPGVAILAGVPEPGTLALLALGALGVLSRRR